MGNRIPISFKNTERDKKLLKIINDQGDKSNFVKDAVEFYINSKNKNLVKPKQESKEIDNDDKQEILDILS